MSYIITSATSSLGIDKKQEPAPLPKSAFPAANTVSQSVIVKNPASVRIIGSGSFHFLYSTTADIGSGVAAGGITGYANTAAAAGVIEHTQDDSVLELPISPCAWSGSGAGVKHVIFVYKGGL